MKITAHQILYEWKNVYLKHMFDSALIFLILYVIFYCYRNQELRRFLYKFWKIFWKFVVDFRSRKRTLIIFRDFFHTFLSRTGKEGFYKSSLLIIPGSLSITLLSFAELSFLIQSLNSASKLNGFILLATCYFYLPV